MVMELLVFPLDLSLDNKIVKNPINSRTWNDLCLGIMENGVDF